MAKLKNNIPVISGEKFTWTGKIGVTEITGLMCVHPSQILHNVPGSYIYDDAADWGFYVQGRFEKILFVYAAPIISGLREHLGWEYTSDKGYIVKILND